MGACPPSLRHPSESLSELLLVDSSTLLRRASESLSELLLVDSSTLLRRIENVMELS